MFYESIDDLPVYNWFKIHETSDLSFLLVKKKKFVKMNQHTVVKKIWTQIYDEYFQKFGFSDNFLSILQKETEISLLIIEKTISGDESINTLIKIIQIEIEKLKGSGSKNAPIDFFKLKSDMEERLKFRINMKECSVTEFYSYISLLQNK